ncbi:MAG: hypothetical protein HC828_13740 [Blastochloris sp.]|nr:hypothetical protein [Blastochloris sp.]
MNSYIEEKLAFERQRQLGAASHHHVVEVEPANPRPHSVPQGARPTRR